MSAAPLPTVEQRLSALAPRLRALRVVRGLCGWVVAALAAVAGVALIDAAFPLPAWARGLYLSVWLTAAGVLAWRWVIVPWRAEIAPAEVARELEKAPALPVKPVAWFGAGAALAVLTVTTTAALVPGSAEQLRRVATPWARPNAQAFRVVVTSGEPVVRRGGHVTLSAYAERIGSGSTAPPEAFLVTRDGPHAPEWRTAMAGDGAAFHATRSAVASDFEYCVEIGPARSEWFRVTALDAVELAPGTEIDIAPPEYATSVPKRTLAALADFDGLQFGTAAFKLKFTHPAATGHLDWRPHGEPKAEWIPLEFAPDHMSATAKLTLRTSGVLRLVLVREAEGKRLRTDTTATVRAIGDEPPRFENLSGVTARPRTAKPGARVPIAFVALDDLSVASAELQYIIGPDESKRASVPIPLSGAGTPRGTGKLDFDLTGKGKEGDAVRFRVVVFDNRGVETTGPQIATFPRSGWSDLRLTATAPALDEQEVVCVRDALHESLTGAGQELTETAAEVAALATAAGDAPLPLDLTVRLNNAREKVHAALTTILDAARDAALTPDLRPLATATREVAETAVRPAEEALRRAETDSAAVRADGFTAAVTHLRAAVTQLDERAARNAQLARARLDRLKLAALAADQTALADAKGGPDLAARQRELLARLVALVAESDPLRAAYDSAKAEEVRQLAAALAELTAHVRELDAAAKQTTAEARAALVAAVTRDQAAVAKRAAALFAKLEIAARLVGVAPPRPDDFRRITDLAAAGKTVDALAEIERHAMTLDRLAAAFEKWAAERADPKLAAKQLAAWQDDLLSRVRAAAPAGGFAVLPDATKDALRAEQKALAAAVEALVLPPDEAVKSARIGAVLHTGAARDFLARDGAGAEDAMKAAVRALNQLAERTPPAGERLTAALRAFEKLRPDQETIANAVEQALRGSDRLTPDAPTCAALAKKLAPQVDKLRRLGTAIAALDLPGLGERQARVVLALQVAVSDLQEGSLFDVQASQQWVRREFDRLKLVLEGSTAPDVKADELHRKLAPAADALDALGPNLTAKLAEPALPVVQEVNRQLAALVAPEATVLLNDARVAIQSAESAFRDAKPDEIARRVRAAVDALARFSERLSGFESDLDRVKRLAASRRAAAEKPKELLTSDEALRQLVREADELANTRVGLAGQLLKKRAHDLYAKLRAKADPDRVGTDLKALAAVLDELAAKMTDVAELKAGVVRPAPPPAGAADMFLPSKPLAEQLRDLEKQQRAVHAQVTNLAAELAGRLRPAADNPFTPLELMQRAILKDALALAKELGTDPAHKAASAATRAADRIRIGSAKAEAEAAVSAFRELAAAGADNPWGRRAADLVSRQAAVLMQLSSLADRPDAITAQQVARTTELARFAGEFALRLTSAAQSFDPNDPATKTLLTAAPAVKEAEKRLAEAARKATAGEPAEAEKFRAGAVAALRAASGAIPVVLVAATLAPGDALRAAERAMRKGDAREAAEALGRAK